MHRVTGSPGATADSSGPSRGGASMQDENHRCVEKEHTEARPQGQKHAKLQTRFTHRPMPSVIALNSSLLLCGDKPGLRGRVWAALQLIF